VSELTPCLRLPLLRPARGCSRHALRHGGIVEPHEAALARLATAASARHRTFHGGRGRAAMNIVHIGNYRPQIRGPPRATSCCRPSRGAAVKCACSRRSRTRPKQRREGSTRPARSSRCGASSAVLLHSAFPPGSDARRLRGRALDSERGRHTASFASREKDTSSWRAVGGADRQPDAVDLRHRPRAAQVHDAPAPVLRSTGFF